MGARLQRWRILTKPSHSGTFDFPGPNTALRHSSASPFVERKVHRTTFKMAAGANSDPCGADKRQLERGRHRGAQDMTRGRRRDLRGLSCRYLTAKAQRRIIMHYKSMQSQAREKHEQLRHEAQMHRLARQSRSQESRPRHLQFASKMAAALAFSLIAGIKHGGTRLRSASRTAARYINDKASAAHS